MNHKPSSEEGNKIPASTISLPAKLNRSNASISKLGKRSNFTSQHQPQWFWRRHHRWSNSQRGLFWGTVIGITVIGSAGCGMALAQFSWIEQAIARQIGLNYTTSEDDLPSLINSLNVLLIEVDNKAEMTDDKVVVFKFNSQTGSAEIINIPAESRVKLPGFGWTTIAESHEYGGTALTIRAVEQLMKIEVNRHLAATVDTLNKLTSSSNLTFDSCSSQTPHCARSGQEIQRQSEQLAAIRHNLDNPASFNHFAQTIAMVKPDLDSNISEAEFVNLASFIRKLKPNKIAINFWQNDNAKSNLTLKHTQDNSQLKSNAALESSSTNYAIAPLKPLPTSLNSPIAVQNTTETPELGMKMVNYLRRQNFRDVYLIEQIPLKLTQTTIIGNRQQLQTANNLKDVLGFGNLAPVKNKSASLTIRIGDDAHNLPEN